MEHTLLCRVTFYRGKRNAPPDLKGGQYCPHVMRKNDTSYVGVRFTEGETVAFDRRIPCRLTPLYENFDAAAFVGGTAFYIMEGPKRVGEGVVDKLCSTVYQCPGK